MAQSESHMALTDLGTGTLLTQPARGFAMNEGTGQFYRSHSTVPPNKFQAKAC